MKPGLYNRKIDITTANVDLPEFVVNIVGSSSGQLDFKHFLETYQDSLPYKNFLHNVRGKAITQLLSSHRLGKYDMYRMIDSGKVDNFGCLTRDAMRKLRPTI